MSKFEKAMQLAMELVSGPTSLAEIKEAAKKIDAALAEARLEGAKAMQEAALDAVQVFGDPTLALRALDPQQVIQEKA